MLKKRKTSTLQPKQNKKVTSFFLHFYPLLQYLNANVFSPLFFPCEFVPHPNFNWAPVSPGSFKEDSVPRCKFQTEFTPSPSKWSSDPALRCDTKGIVNYSPLLKGDSDRKYNGYRGNSSTFNGFNGKHEKQKWVPHHPLHL